MVLKATIAEIIGNEEAMDLYRHTTELGSHVRNNSPNCENVRYFYRTISSSSTSVDDTLVMHRAIFVWHLDMKTRKQNGNNKLTEIERFDWLIERTQTRVAFGWLSERSIKLHARELSRNQPILRFDVILQHDWPIEQCLLLIRVLSGGKRKRPYFDLFIHWMIKQITNTYHFPRSYENRSIPQFLNWRLKEALVLHTGFAQASYPTRHLKITWYSKENLCLLCLIFTLSTEKLFYNRQQLSVNTQVTIWIHT